MLKIFILSCWRSGTSWLEDILGKNVEGSTLFGHEQQILPLLTIYKKCYGKINREIRKKANKPFCDISEEKFHEELGFKQHKVINNSFRWSGEDFKSFALRFIEFLTFPYQNKYDQVVEKSPENGSPEVFNCTIETFSGIQDYALIYLFREFKPYLSSCYKKFVLRKDNDIYYYANKWIEWNSNAVKTIKEKNPSVFILKYEDLVNNPTIVDNFCLKRKKKIKIRPNTLTKWEDSKAINQIKNIYDENIDIIKEIGKFINEKKIK